MYIRFLSLRADKLPSTVGWGVGPKSLHPTVDEGVSTRRPKNHTYKYHNSFFSSSLLPFLICCCPFVIMSPCAIIATKLSLSLSLTNTKSQLYHHTFLSPFLVYYQFFSTYKNPLWPICYASLSSLWFPISGILILFSFCKRTVCALSLQKKKKKPLWTSFWHFHGQPRDTIGT